MHTWLIVVINLNDRWLEILHCKNRFQLHSVGHGDAFGNLRDRREEENYISIHTHEEGRCAHLTSFRYTSTRSSPASTRCTNGASESGGDPSCEERPSFTSEAASSILGLDKSLKHIRTSDVSAVKPDRSLISTITMLVVGFAPLYLNEGEKCCQVKLFWTYNLHTSFKHKWFKCCTGGSHFNYALILGAVVHQNSMIWSAFHGTLSQICAGTQRP